MQNVTYKVTVRDLPLKRVAALRHRGDYLEIGATFDRVRRVFDARALWAPGQAMIGVYYDNPAVVPTTELASHAGVVVGEDALIHELFDTVVLRGGRYAVMEVPGSYQGLPDAYRYLHDTWLSETGENADLQEPLHEVYVRAPNDPDGPMTEIHMALA